MKEIAGLKSEVLLSAERIEDIVGGLARRITADYAGKEVLLIGILRGAFVVLADLMRRIELSCEVAFMEVSSYGAGTTSSGIVRILKDLEEDIAGKHVIVVEDIIDTGITLSYLRRSLLARSPASLEFLTLLSKPSRRRVELDVKYVGKEIPDEFVVGYGIDYAGKYRNLPDIYALDVPE
ncbi:HGPRTase: hypoxanthine phosphoribosyltransferase [Rubrobacter radiotolerans]|uniref:Hypoxanthine phosphoribosyltransferase n=1 Tax=Rubrobacter radiotolerans TaxID=42256 RepID=A0A023WZ86_RUBRA|nr:hypoxanthine phosphoribosyltransferase [Rubrobacter radiotolerans]AHY45408.1 HGPRTase: hypoxanthine phosphoribosyltransferase [Rubrobacter radiotolerans]MDX5892819.1 hypoxanthine phosphoribosyltransferase [Rubrobacter radiotolerans]SMC02553.1 hypoxanthine phosphoribosyltransferase [Rubrobacter radiotolerans DSM 5868]